MFEAIDADQNGALAAQEIRDWVLTHSKQAPAFFPTFFVVSPDAPGETGLPSQEMAIPMMVIPMMSLPMLAIPMLAVPTLARATLLTPGQILCTSCLQVPVPSALNRFLQCAGWTGT